MAKQRYINTKFWSDTYISNLDPVEKLLFLYLFTNERTSICGMYELPLKLMAVETGIEKEMVEKILKRFSKDKKVFYYQGWIRMVNFPKHQDTGNEKIRKGIELAESQIPAQIKDKLYAMDSLSIPLPYVSNNSNTNSNSNSNTNPNNIATSSVAIDTTSLQFLMNLPDEVIKEFSDQFNCYETEIRGKAEDLYNYCLAKGKKYKDYRAFLRNAIKKDFGPRRKEPTKEWEKPENTKVSEEGLKKLRELKDKFKIGK